MARPSPTAARRGDAMDAMRRSADYGEPDDRSIADPGFRARAARWTAALLAAVTVAGAAACAGPPSKGDIHGVALNQSRNNVFILAREPSADMAPGTLVTNFLQALTGDQKDPAFSVAQEYLTPNVRSHWNPGSSTTEIIQSPPQMLVDPPQITDGDARPASDPSSPQQAPPTTPTAGTTATVTVSGTEIAQIDSFGFFSYEAEPQPVTQTLTLKYLGTGTGWRIDVPPKFRMVNAESFKRVYQTYQSPLAVYLPSRGVVVPQMDQVYLTQDSGKVDYTYDALARAVLHGRYSSQNTGLALQTPVSVDQNGLATVALQAPPAGTDLNGVWEAIFRTFRDASQTQQLLSPTPLTKVDVTNPGCGSICHHAASFISENPLLPTVYWVCPQQGQNGTNAAIVLKQLPGTGAVCPQNGKAQSVVAMTGVQLAKNSPIAVKQSMLSTDVKVPTGPTTVAVVEQDGSVVVLNDKNNDQHPWYRAAAAQNVTDLEWDPVDGSLWVVDNNNLYRVQDPGNNGPSSQSEDLVAVPGGSLTRFKLSPDGLRAVVVNGQAPASSTPASGPNPQAAWMVTVDRTGDAPTLPTDTPFQLLAGGAQEAQGTVLQSVTDAAWADGRTLVLLGTQAGSTTPKLFKVYSDGSQDSTIIDPDDAQPGAKHIAAAMGVNVGRPSLWTFSDAPGLNDATTMDLYFKRSGGSDSSQEIGFSPVQATLTAG